MKWLGLLPNADIGEICIVWAVVYGLGAGTIDLNIIFDKFVNRKAEVSEEGEDR